LLSPDYGDDVSTYEHEYFKGDEKTGPIYILKHKENGDCFYLGPEGCTIHERAPAICREFDCRKFYATRSRAERKAQIAKGHIDKRVFDAGRKRLSSLTEQDWLEVKGWKVAS